jgi:hypothetical protein
MKIKLYATKIEGYDETDECIFKVEGFDEGSCNVEISTMVDIESWNEIKDCIGEAIALSINGLQSKEGKDVRT